MQGFTTTRTWGEDDGFHNKFCLDAFFITIISNWINLLGCGLQHQTIANEAFKIRHELMLT